MLSSLSRNKIMFVTLVAIRLIERHALNLFRTYSLPSFVGMKLGFQFVHQCLLDHRGYGRCRCQNVIHAGTSYEVINVSDGMTGFHSGVTREVVLMEVGKTHCTLEVVEDAAVREVTRSCICAWLTQRGILYESVWPISFWRLQKNQLQYCQKDSDSILSGIFSDRI